jgi:hypothetical protein
LLELDSVVALSNLARAAIAVVQLLLAAGVANALAL